MLIGLSNIKLREQQITYALTFAYFLQSNLNVHTLHSSPFLLKNPKEGYVYGLTGTTEGSNYGLADHWLCIYQMDGREYSQLTIIYEIYNHMESVKTTSIYNESPEVLCKK